jgi:hypothetical protein
MDYYRVIENVLEKIRMKKVVPRDGILVQMRSRCLDGNSPRCWMASHALGKGS